MARHALCVVAGERLQVEAALVAEGVVEALASDPHGGGQVVGGGAGEALRPEHLDGGLERCVTVQSLRSPHPPEIGFWNAEERRAATVSTERALAKTALRRLTHPFSNRRRWYGHRCGDR